MKNVIQKLVTIVLILVVTISQINLTTVLADVTIYATAEDGTNYYSIDAAWNAATSGKKITMTNDWLVSGFLYVPHDNAVVTTIDMNGHKIYRNQTSKQNAGYVLQVGGNSTLKLTSSVTTTFNYKSWPDTTQSDATLETGGLVTGGWNNDNAGGVFVGQDSKLYLDNVSVAGNRSDGGYGGGVYVLGTDASIYLSNGAHIEKNLAKYGGGVYFNKNNGAISLDNNSSISFNYAEKDGGGIYSDGRYTHVYLTNHSMINNNSGESGGGIYFNYTNIVLKSSDNTGKLLNNRARTSNKGQGGAVYICKNQYDSGSASTIDNVGIVSGIEFSNNSSYDDGGAIYIHQENITISNCSIVNNTAEDEGGGIYNNNDGTTISSSTIKNNISKSNGAGIFTSCYNDITLSGKVYVTDNQRNDNSKDNLFLSNSLALGKNAQINGSPKGEVGIRIDENHSNIIGKTTTYFDTSVFSYDLSDNYHFEFDETYKTLELKEGAPQEKIQVTDVSPDVSSTGKTYNGKDLKQGYFSFLSVEDSFTDCDSKFYYSDGYFLNGNDGNNGDPTVYNTHLASMSMVMAISAFYSSVGSDGTLSDQLKDNEKYGDRTYTYKSQNIKKLFTDIGIDQDKIFINDFNSVKPSTGSIGVAIGSKTITRGNDEYTLVPIAIRGQGYESEWASNVTVGDSGEEGGFAGAADQVLDVVNQYIDDYNLKDSVKNGKVKFWIAGYSRAGATSNLTAKRLVEKYCSGESDSTNNQVYAYCFEAPQGGVNSAMKLDESKYYSIHNCINKVDLVPLVAPKEMGFMRYGVDHYVPGSISSNVNTDTSVWSILKDKDWASTYKTWYDNEAYEVGSSNYDTSEMINQLLSIDKDIYFTDYFKIADFDLTGFVFGDLIDEVSYEGEAITQSEYLQIFWRALLSWSLYSGYTGDYRDSYANEVGESVSEEFSPYSFQKSLQAIIGIYYGKTTLEQEDIATCLSNGASAVVDGEHYKDLYSLLGGWTKMTKDERQKWIGKFWNYFMNTYCYDTQSTAASYFSTSELAEIKSAFYTVIDIVFRMVDADYATKANQWNESHAAVKDESGKFVTTPLTDGVTDKQKNYGSDSEISVLCTLVYNMTSIAEGHYPEINFAWLRTYDSFYKNDSNKPVNIVTNKTPTVTSTLNKRELTLNTDINGSSIFYRLKSDDGEYSAWKPYNTVIDLEVEKDVAVTYTVQYSAIYCGNISDVQEEEIKLSGKHKVSINDEVYGYYDTGEETLVNGTGSDKNKVFKSWNLLDDIVTDDNKNQTNIKFIMPDKNVNLTANYVECITDTDNLTLSVATPIAGQPLSSSGILSWNKNGTDRNKEVSITWVEVVDGKTSVASGNAKYNATYYAYVRQAQDLTDNIAFNVTKDGVTVKYGETSEKAETVQINPNGSLLILGPTFTTQKVDVTNVVETNANVMSEYTQENIKAILPSVAIINGNDGNAYVVSVDVNNADYSNVNYVDDLCKGGYVIVPLQLGDKYNNTENKTLKVNLNVTSVPPASAPTSSIKQDVYNQDELKVDLSTTTENGTIKYSINGGDYQTYFSTDQINLTSSKGTKTTFIIKAYVESDEGNYSQSTETILTYVLDNPYTVTVKGKDTGLKEELFDDKEYSFYTSESLKIGAPLETDEQFNHWESIPIGVTGQSPDEILTVSEISEDTILTAIYNPIVKNIEVNLDVPYAGEILEKSINSLNVTVTDTYDFTKYVGDITWYPNQEKASYGTTYTAKVILDTNIYAIIEGASINVNNNSSVKTNVVKETKEDKNVYALYITFPSTKYHLLSIDELDQIVVSRENASSNNWNLPEKTTLKLTNGNQVDGSIIWNLEPDKSFDSTNPYSQLLTFTGIVSIPDNIIVDENISKEITVSVLIPSLDQVENVIADVESGTYENTKYVELSCKTEGATIYYTLDGSDPTSESLVYDGGLIEIKETTTLKTIAIKENMIDSPIAEYIYTIEIPDPTPTPTVQPTTEPTASPTIEPEPTNSPDSSGDDSSSPTVNCEETKGRNWTWSNKKHACVYKVTNTSSK